MYFEATHFKSTLSTSVCCCFDFGKETSLVYISDLFFGNLKKMSRFKEDYKAKLSLSELKWSTTSSSIKRHDHDHLSTVFQEIVSWCIKGQTEKLKEVLDSQTNPIYKDVLFSTLKDLRSGLNIREIVATIGQIKVMKLIHQEQTSPHLYLGSAFGIAIRNLDLEMVQCILSRKNSRFRCTQSDLRSVWEPEGKGREIFKAIVTFTKETKSKSKRLEEEIDFEDELFRAIREERYELVKILIENGADPNEPRGHEEICSPLCHAMFTGNYEIVEYLINNGSNRFFFSTKKTL